MDAIKDQDTEVFSHHAATHFMTAVSHSNIKFLDFEKSNQFCNNMKSCHKKLFVEVIHSMLTKEPGSFPHLTGFKIRLDFGDWWTEDNNLWNTFPKSLSHLNIEIVQWPRKWGIGKLSKVVSILQRHAFTLQTLTLNWVADEDVVSYTKLELPRLPLLTTLDFMSDSNVSISDGWTMEMLDCLKLRELFLVRRLNNFKKSIKICILLNFCDMQKIAFNDWRQLTCKFGIMHTCKFVFKLTFFM